MEPIHNAQLELAFNFVQYTNKNIFLTGKAGTGKTTFLHNLKIKSPKRMIVVAPTGVAAINAGGVTIHSFFQLSFGPYLPIQKNSENPFHDFEEKPTSDSVKHFSREKINIIKSLDLLVIDEISMVRADILDAIDEVLRKYKNRFEPFGGTQLLMIGDLQQLAPIAKDDEWDILKNYYENTFFFSSRALQKTRYISIELKHIYRQSDYHFIQILNKVRENNLDDETLNELNKRHKPNFNPSDNEGYITLTTHNYQAQGINESKLNKLKVKPHTFKAILDGDFPESTYPTEFELTMKVGAQVMFVKNDSSYEKRYYNGKIGTVTDIDEDTIYVKCPNETSTIPTKKEVWHNTKYSIDSETKAITEKIAGTFTQYPLKLAWAITIHKSQGLTFERAIIDANSAFAHGQVYVALSRCKTLEGMVLSTPVAAKSIKSDSTVSQFVHDIEQNPPKQELLEDSKKEYERTLILELFDFNGINRRLIYLLKLINNHQESFHKTASDPFIKMSSSLKIELVEVSEKFKIQVQQLLTSVNSVEENEPLQERLKKANSYFSEKVESIIINTLNEIAVETDNKAIRKQITDQVDRLKEESSIKLKCLKSCLNGFNTKDYLDIRAKAAIEKVEQKVKPKSEYSTNRKTSSEPYATLKAWRDDKADELDVAQYLVLPQKTLLLLANQLPCNLAELKNIKGLGKAKIQQFGSEILEIIIEYRINNGIELPQAEIELTPSKKIEKIDSKKISFELFKEGKSIVEIASERKMALSTIEGHLAHYVGTGELDISNFLTQEKIDQISKYFISNKSKSLSNAKAEFGDKVSYFELKFVLKRLEFDEKLTIE
ncbi:MAG: helicase [Bacteroidales bacterium]|nr:MAG: helicase [Bacteroidales bacterium]